MTDAAALSTEELSSQEISDAVWLAARIAAAGPHSAHESAGPPPPPMVRPPHRPDQAPPVSHDVEEPVSFARTPVPTSVRLVSLGRRSQSATTSAPPSERSVLPDLPPGLPKALRPLNRLVPSWLDCELDEEKTAVAAAESRVWLPVHRPSYEHPFEVVLVVDRGSSMRIWERTTSAFRTLLERQGAFSDVRTVWVDTDETCVESVETAPGTHRAPALLADPTGKRIILVLTDGVGKAWTSGAMFTLMSLWARTCQVALVHLLPPERWDWTGIRVEPRTLHTTQAIPVLALESRFLRRWAELVSGTGGVRLPVLVPPGDENGEPEDHRDDLTPDERIRRFRATATPNAVRLAGLLAAAPLNLRVMQAVHGTFLPGSHHWNLAEVLLGGLVHKVPRDSASPVEYEFRPGLRGHLLATVTRDETAYVQRVVEDVLGREEPAVANLRSVLADPDHVDLPAVTAENAPVLDVLRQVFTALSGPYARRATRLADVLGTEAAGAIDFSGIEETAHATDLGNPPVTTTSSEPSGTEVRRSERKPTVWGGVPLRNVNFIGRRDLLGALRSELAKSTATAVLPGALHGMGGIGKSQIAVEYVYRHASDYDLIWWIPSEEPSGIQKSLVDLARRLDLPVEQLVDTAVPAVLEALGNGEPFRRWLLVFDNADRPEDVRTFWPRRGDGHIIVTSRNGEWAGVAQTVEVDVFQRAESRELLQRRNKDLADEEADRLATVLGDLPLAVEQAAAWRAETGMKVDEYLRLFEDKRTELLASRAPADYDVAVEAAWNVSLDRLREESPGALELLEVCAFFSPEPISRDIFSGVRNIPVSEDLGNTLADPIQLGRAIREINRYSLAKLDHRNDTLQLHRLVQMVLRNKLSPEEQERVRHTAHLLLANRDPKMPESVDNWARYAELLPHVRAVDARNCTDQWVRHMAINVVHYLFAFGDPAGGLEMARDFAQFWGEKLGEKHPDTLIVSRWLGRMLRALGRFDEGHAVGQRTLDRMRETLGEEHEETLLTMQGVASGLRATGAFAAARTMNEFAYKTAVKKFGPDDPDSLSAANNYALSLRLVGDFAAARQLDEDTLRRKQIVLGEDHRFTLLTADNWSVDLREVGDYLRSRTEQEDTVRRMRAQLGDRHPMTLSAIKNLAIAYRKAGEHLNKKSLNLAIEATDGLITKYGESHPDAMSAAMDLSIEHRQDGNLIESRRLGEHVKSLYERTWGVQHPFSVAAATNLAVTLRLLGLIGQARALNEKAVADLRGSVGADHPFTLVCATNLASDLAAADDFDGAFALDEDTFDRSVRVLGEDHPSTLAVMVNKALDQRGLGRHDEAANLQLHAVERLRRVLGATHPATNDAQFNHRANCDIDPMQI
ncbi:FxSxx-COOH system tetratricopeptide repeat protein [Actinophytocola sp.]|uniref:FxSxx-COOH system tetratricopeptide repeat protein n=1 Tax=Actinophytocola sp. TaxID=1872138 RepID=UPI002ED4CF5D